MKLKTFALGGIVAAILSGCGVTFESFEDLTPEERGIKVCYATKGLRMAMDSCDRYLKDIPAIEEDIKRGYAIVEECGYEEQEDGYDEECYPLSNGGKECKRIPRMKAVEQCDEMKHAIDIGEETDRIRSLHEMREGCQEQMRLVIKTCIEETSKMTPEDAYKLYERNAAME